MVVPFIALILIIVVVIWFLAGAGKRKKEGKDLGDRNAGNPIENTTGRSV